MPYLFSIQDNSPHYFNFSRTPFSTQWPKHYMCHNRLPTYPISIFLSSYTKIYNSISSVFEPKYLTYLPSTFSIFLSICTEIHNHLLYLNFYFLCICTELLPITFASYWVFLMAMMIFVHQNRAPHGTHLLVICSHLDPPNWLVPSL